MGVSRHHAIVVGGTRGIGRATVGALSHRGDAVSVVARNPPEVVEVDGLVSFFEADARDEKALADAFRRAREQVGPVDYLVCCQRNRSQAEEWESEIDTTLKASSLAIEGSVEHFHPSGGSIVLMGSTAGRYVIDGQPLSYHVAKAGIEQIVRYYAISLGSRKIRVNGVSPSTVIKAESEAYFDGNPRVAELFDSISPLGRIGTADEVASVIAFLCSPAAALINGQTILADGGVGLMYPESLARREFRL